MAFLIGCVTIVGMAAAFATGSSDEAADETAANVFLGELDLAERMEIWRNQYRRMTPGDEPFVQDVGTWPAAWEEFGNTWDSAPAERNLATWLVPFFVERIGLASIIRDANGTILWNGTTDFAKDESADVMLTGELVDEEEWVLWNATQEKNARWLASMYYMQENPMRGGSNGPCTTGLHFVSAVGVFSTSAPPELHVGLVWTNNGTVDVFAYGPLHVAETNEVTITNDENAVVTVTNVSWHAVEPTLTGGYDNLWELVGTLTVSNTGTNVFIDTNFPPGRAKVRYYAAFETGDADNDGLNDAFETTILGTSANSTDSDNDGISDWDEYHVHRTDPSASDSDHDGIDDPTEIQNQTNPNRWDTDGDGGGDAVDTSPCVSNLWWIVSKTTNEWTGYGHEYLGNQSSWPTNPVRKNQLVVQGVRPSTDAIPGRVTLWGLVDDAIMVDSNKVAWTNGAKVLSNLDVTASITNLTSDSFRMDLFDWPDLPDGGDNEVRLGRSDCPFRAIWEWWIPVEILLEPIHSNPTPPLENPSGIIQGSNAWFQVLALPLGIIPNTNIVWTSEFHKVDFAVTNRGSVVEVYASSLGEDRLHVDVEGATGSFGLPPFNVRVLPLTVITAKVGVVVKNGVGATTTNNVVQAMSYANKVLAQTGKQIEVMWPIVEIPFSDGFWDVHCSTLGTPALLNEIPAFGGLKLYFVNSITMPSGGVGAGVTYPNGTLISTTSTTFRWRTIAHEFCHSCGLRDLYMSNQQETTLVASGNICSNRMPDDWGYYEKNGTDELPLSDIMTRLLMYWQPIHDDIPTGEVYGLWYSKENNVYNWHLTNAPVGLSGMTNTPVHQ